MTRATSHVVLMTLLAWAVPLSSQAPPPQGTVIRTDTVAVGGGRVPADIGRFTVPANRATDVSPWITLGFVRFRSTAGRPAPPIVILAGGPGDAATRVVRGMPDNYLSRLRAIADVVAFDQRGTGMSEPHAVRCPPQAPQSRDQPGDPDRLLVGMRSALILCLENAARRGVDVMGLTTAESADDVAALARVLQAPRISLLAGSYGTHLAVTIARRHPALVADMVLAGIEGPDDTFKLPSRVDSVLVTIAAAREPALMHDLHMLQDQLASSPASFTFPDGQTIVLGPWDFQRWVAGALGTRREIDAMIENVRRMKHGDVSALARWTFRQRFPSPFNLMHIAMDCASSASAGRRARIQREAPGALLGDAINFPASGLCDLPGLPRLPDPFRAPATITTPALLIAGTFDGRTPIQNARELARDMPAAQVLVMDGASHDLLGMPTVMEATLRFFQHRRPVAELPSAVDP